MGGEASPTPPPCVGPCLQAILNIFYRTFKVNCTVSYVQLSLNCVYLKCQAKSSTAKGEETYRLYAVELVETPARDLGLR